MHEVTLQSPNWPTTKTPQKNHLKRSPSEVRIAGSKWSYITLRYYSNASDNNKDNRKTEEEVSVRSVESGV